MLPESIRDRPAVTAAPSACQPRRATVSGHCLNVIRKRFADGLPLRVRSALIEMAVIAQPVKAADPGNTIRKLFLPWRRGDIAEVLRETSAS